MKLTEDNWKDARYSRAKRQFPPGRIVAYRSDGINPSFGQVERITRAGTVYVALGSFSDYIVVYEDNKKKVKGYEKSNFSLDDDAEILRFYARFNEGSPTWCAAKKSFAQGSCLENLVKDDDLLCIERPRNK